MDVIGERQELDFDGIKVSVLCPPSTQIYHKVLMLQLKRIRRQYHDV
jgi:hypothetical protein